MVQRCSVQTKDDYTRLEKCLRGGPDRSNFEKYIEKLRNRAIFHYDQSLVEKVIAERARREEARILTYTMGDSLRLWRFEAADHLIDSIITRRIWGIPRNSDQTQEADRINDYITELGRSFVGFSGEYCDAYLRENASV